jgi:hypothetical protein
MHFPLASISLVAVVAAGVYASVPASVRAALSRGADSDPQPVEAAFVPIDTISDELEVPVLRAGLTPEFLAAAGISSGAVNVILNAAADDFGDGSALEAADATFTSARQTHDSLQRLVKSGLGSDEDVTALTAAETALDSATAARDLVLSSALAAGKAEMTSAQQATIATLCANRSRRFPTEFLVLDLESADWLKLRSALGDEKAAPKLGLDPNPELQSFLSAKRADSAVATAKANLDSNLAAIQTAWDASFTD